MSANPIYVRLIGGLGNQLFQYASARAASLRQGVPLVLDARHYKAGDQFAYGLDHFAIEARIGSEDELPPARNRPIPYFLWRTLKLKPRFLREASLGFNEAIHNAAPGVYLHGYLQTERYFADAAPQIRRELSIVTPPSEENRRWLDHIAAVPSVSLHVRRGDYVSDSKAGRSHGTCTLDYYSNAVRLVAAEMAEEPVFFVFSDDPDWARENIRLGFETHVAGHNDFTRNYEDLRLMSACRHHIIANSSFSWWGAWLDPSPDKIVVAPERWFADPALSNPDIVPAGWPRVPG